MPDRMSMHICQTIWQVYMSLLVSLYVCTLYESDMLRFYIWHAVRMSNFSVEDVRVTLADQLGMTRRYLAKHPQLEILLQQIYKSWVGMGLVPAPIYFILAPLASEFRLRYFRNRFISGRSSSTTVLYQSISWIPIYCFSRERLSAGSFQ